MTSSATVARNFPPRTLPPRNLVKIQWGPPRGLVASTRRPGREPPGPQSRTLLGMVASEEESDSESDSRSKTLEERILRVP